MSDRLLSSTLTPIAPRIARALAQEKAHDMRGLVRCSCSWNRWRIQGHEYDTGGCFDMHDAKRIRGNYEKRGEIFKDFGA